MCFHVKLATISAWPAYVEGRDSVMAKIRKTGKGKRAFDRLNAVDSEVHEIKKILDLVSQNITETFEREGIKFEPKTKQQKIRGMIDALPNRIEFTGNRLKFYIDFMLLTSEGDDPADIRGSIIYGTSRTLCFRDCIFPKPKDDKDTEKCKLCERIVRCDGLEDKPIIQFTVNRQGIAKSRGELNDEWRIAYPKENKEKLPEITQSLLDLHYRALDHIWKDALDWTNENILP